LSASTATGRISSRLGCSRRLRERGKAGLKIVYDLNFPPNLSDLAVPVEPMLIVRGAIRERLAQVHAEGCTEVQGARV
jgi:hypothetical protein